MRPRCITIPLFLAALGMAYSQDWVEVSRTSKLPSNTYSAAFSDETDGIGVGYSGLAILTKDGGKTWDSGRNKSMCLFACQMLDASRCFATGNGSFVIVSRDGGMNWEPVSSIAGPGRSISFVDELRGWAAAKDWLGETKDGGKSWSKLALPQGVKKIETVMLSSDCGFLVSQDGSIFRTKDSGATWEALAAPFPRAESEYSHSYGNFAQAVGLSFSGPKGVVAAIVNSGGKHLVSIKRTEDDGATWSEAEDHALGASGSSLTMSADFISVLGQNAVVTLFERAK